MKSIITCPLCQNQQTASVPKNACMFRYQCDGCQKIFQAKPEDCCVFCSYADEKPSVCKSSNC